MLEENTNFTSIEERIEAIEKEIKIQAKKRIVVLREIFSLFQKKNDEDFRNSIYLNEELLQLVVLSYFEDIYRFKEYSGSQRADRHKQAGYTIKWISKIKPIQIKPDTEIKDTLIYVNGSFALLAGFSFLDPRVAKSLSAHYITNLLYTSLYRDVSGRQLASTMYVIEQFAKKEDQI